MKKILSALFLLLVITGCSNESSQDTLKSHFKESDPPAVQFKIEDTVYSTEQGSYCWRNEKSAQCVSAAFPAEILENTKPIKVKSKETITLLMKRPPSEQTLTIENGELNQIEEIPINKANQFKAPELEGVYIFNYYAIWEKDDSGTSGDSSYVFKIEVK